MKRPKNRMAQVETREPEQAVQEVATSPKCPHCGCDLADQASQTPRVRLCNVCGGRITI